MMTTYMCLCVILLDDVDGPSGDDDQDDKNGHWASRIAATSARYTLKGYGYDFLGHKGRRTHSRTSTRKSIDSASEKRR